MSNPVTVRWIAHTELSAAHAAFVVATGARCTDQKTEQLLVDPVTDINNRLLSSSIDVSSFWQHYLSETMNGADVTRACTVALLASGCSELQIEQTTKAISHRMNSARQAFLQRFPKLAEQLELRARPLRDRWDTVGPGLLGEVGRLVWQESPPSDWWTQRIDALTVQPVRGGDGGFDAFRSTIWVEAMLTDVDPAVPEVLRVAWLITRMAIESYTRERSADQSLSTPWSLVSVPLVLSAARRLDIIGGSELPIHRAMELWQFSDAATAATLARWWDDYLDQPKPLPAALLALEQSLGRLPSTDRDRAGDT